MMRLTITRNSGGPKATGSGYRYVLGMPGKDGEPEQTLDVTSSLTSLHLRMNVKEINSAQITFLLDDVDIKAEALAALKAHMQEREEANEELLETTTAESKTRTYIDPSGEDPR